MLRFRRLAALSLACVLLMSLTPVTSASAARRGTSRPRPAGPTATADVYEQDDQPDDARDVTSLFAAIGSNTYHLERHTIDLAPDDSAECDQDWFRFTVSPDDLADGTSYLIEADFRFIGPPSCLVIELYGPGLSEVNPIMPPDVETLDSDVTLTGCVEAALGDPWHDDGGVSSISFVPFSEGEYFFRVRPWRNPPDPAPGFYKDTAGEYDLRLKKGFMTRRGGADRVDTAVQFSRELYPDGVLTGGGSDAFGDAVIVANGWNYPDALAGSTLAGAISAPLLLTTTSGLSAGTSAEIDRLEPQRIYILGGTSAVSANVETALRAKLSGHPEDCVRLEGAGRVQTAARIAAEVYGDGGGSSERGAFVVNGWSFADALAAAPLASLNNAPILLTHTGYLDSATRDAIEDRGITDVVIVGSNAAVSSAVQSQLQTLLGGAGHVRRVQGVSRYETAREFAAWASGLRAVGGTPDAPRVGTVAAPDLLQALEPNRIGVASGENFPDALSGGVWCGRAHAPLLLTPSRSMSPYIFSPSHVTPSGGTDLWTEIMTSTGVGFGRSYLFGGPPAVSNPVFLQLDSVTGGGAL